MGCGAETKDLRLEDHKDHKGCEELGAKIDKEDRQENYIKNRINKGRAITAMVNGVLCNNTFKYHVVAPMGRFQLELIYLYFPPSFHLTVGCFCPVGLSLL